MSDLPDIQRGGRRARRVRTNPHADAATPSGPPSFDTPPGPAPSDTSVLFQARLAARVAFASPGSSSDFEPPGTGIRRVVPDEEGYQTLQMTRGDQLAEEANEELGEEELEDTEVGDDMMEDQDQFDGEDVMDEGDGGDEVYDDQEDEEEPEEPQKPPFDPSAVGLKEINNLAHFGVSSHKPGNGVDELLSDDLDKYWQSDGQQPHLLTIHFVRRVEIRAIRFYVDYQLDESYTPTHINFYAGTGHHDLIPFAEMALANPRGWQDVPLSATGGGPDGHSLCCHIVQVHVKENHQNGKDTHIRGIKIFALDETVAGGNAVGMQMESHIDQAADRAIGGIGADEHEIQHLLESFDAVEGSEGQGGGLGMFSGVPEYMRDPEIR